MEYKSHNDFFKEYVLYKCNLITSQGYFNKQVTTEIMTFVEFWEVNKYFALRIHAGNAKNNYIHSPSSLSSFRSAWTHSSISWLISAEIISFFTMVGMGTSVVPRTTGISALGVERGDEIRVGGLKR